MAKVKLDFKRLPIAERIVRVRQIVANLTGNPDFPTPNPLHSYDGATVEDQYLVATGHIGVFNTSSFLKEAVYE